MDKSESTVIDRRLARIEGQVRGIRRMLEAEAYCIDILAQVSAATSALNQVAASIVAKHVQHCLAHDESAHAEALSRTRDEMLEEVEQVIRKLVR